MTTHIELLEKLSPEDFDTELNDAFGVVATFRPFLEPSVIHRSVEFLQNLRDNLDSQLTRYPDGNPHDPTWKQRTVGFRGVVSSRLHMAQGRVRVMDKEADRVGTYRQWKRFAHDLANALDVIGTDEALKALDDIHSPFPDLTAGQWLDIRLEKRAARAKTEAPA